jgi:hypothetical protein
MVAPSRASDLVLSRAYALPDGFRRSYVLACGRPDVAASLLVDAPCAAEARGTAGAAELVASVAVDD